MADDGTQGGFRENREDYYALAYQESVRGLTQQAGVLDNVRTRAGLLITAANVVTALLATQAIGNRPGIGPGGGVAIGAFIVTMVLSLYILLPKGEWNFAFDAYKLHKMIEGEGYPSLGALQRRLARLNEDSQTANVTKLERMFSAFRWACVALTVEVIVWVVVLAKVTVCGVLL
jgi:hypothetical protein